MELRGDFMFGFKERAHKKVHEEANGSNTTKKENATLTSGIGFTQNLRYL